MKKAKNGKKIKKIAKRNRKSNKKKRRERIQLFFCVIQVKNSQNSVTIGNLSCVAMGEHTKSASTPAQQSASLVAAETEHMQQLHQQQQQASTSSGSAGLTPSSMAESSSNSAAASLSAKDARELQEIRNLLWGSTIRLDVFRRWSQGRRGYTKTDCTVKLS